MNPLRTKAVSAGALSVCAMLCAAPARAQKTDGKVQLALSAPVAGYQSYQAETSGAKTDYSGIVWGLPGTSNALGESVVNFELGYGIGKFVVAGLIFRADGSSLKYDPKASNQEDRQSFGFSAGPKVDLVFSPGEDLRPFLGVAGGLTRAWTSANVDNAPNRESQTKGYFFTGRFGFHVFATPSFSIDPMLVFNYLKSDETADTGIDVVDIETNRKGFDAGLALGISGWI